MDAQMRESFLRDLVILQSPLNRNLSNSSSSYTSSSYKSDNSLIDRNQDIVERGPKLTEVESSTLDAENTGTDYRQVSITLLADSADRRIPHLLLRSSTKIIRFSKYYVKQRSLITNHKSPARLKQPSASGKLAMTEKSFLPKKALVLRKFSRLEYERLCYPNLSEEQLAINLSQRGSIYESLKHHDQIQKSSLQQIESVLHNENIEFQTVDRFGYTDDKINWADMIITSGGDGTFLMAASKVATRDKPVIGVNSDPTKSVGHLCLPSQYSNNFEKVIEHLKNGSYKWLYKQRLRITLIGEVADEDPRELNDIRCNLHGINKFLDLDQASPPKTKSPYLNALHQQLPGPLGGSYSEVSPSICNVTPTDIARLNFQKESTPTLAGHQSDRKMDSPSSTALDTNDPLNNGLHAQSSSIQPRKSFRTADGRVFYKIRQLKERALNEVFVGETLSARVSYYELSVNDAKLVKIKSSGLTVCSGTGSTSWYYNINKITDQQTQSIIEIINKVTSSTKIQTDDTEMISDITRQFNDKLPFSATEPIMAYSIRDPVDYASVLGQPQRGFAKRIEVKSKMQNACLVLDGCQFYPFNDGSYALIELHDEDALKTMSIE